MGKLLSFVISMLENIHCHLELGVLDKWYSPPAQQCETACMYSIQDFLAKQLCQCPSTCII